MEPYEQQQKQKPFHSCGHRRRSSSNKMLKSNHRFEMPNYHHDHDQNDEYGRRKLPIFSVSNKVTSLMSKNKKKLPIHCQN